MERRVNEHSELFLHFLRDPLLTSSPSFDGRFPESLLRHHGCQRVEGDRGKSFHLEVSEVQSVRLELASSHRETSTSVPALLFDLVCQQPVSIDTR